MADTKPAQDAESVRVCIVCRMVFNYRPWDVMTPDLVNHGPMCSTVCVDDFCALYDETHEVAPMMATKHPIGTCIVCDIARRERHEALREMTARADYDWRVNYMLSPPATRSWE